VPPDPELEPEPDQRVLRPEASVLDEQSLVPDPNLLEPPPNRFTHRLTRRAPYFYGSRDEAGAPDGELPAGTEVVLLRRDGERCRVADGQGLYVEVDGTSIEELPGSSDDGSSAATERGSAGRGAGPR
jgi:hypothetical protein